ncbi:ion channel [Saccharospirillum salsuginis]|uniref:Potassium channel domain-containing protein n=1 Tax=Saccharospirillum salsuginis TaxID=418750 RepID=A0A918KG30_9GAMM|nr:ion channel [Saccharospirillum salsuginis]GGX62485.1 hypothetical protein GCM10007392_32980 [Saccharospirillum salsuginis]
MNITVIPIPDDGRFTFIRALIRTFLSWILAFIVWFVLSYFYEGESNALIAFFGSLSVYFAYSVYLKSLHDEHSNINNYQLLSLVGLYLLIAVIVVVLYAAYYAVFDFVVGNGTVWESNFHNALYFSVVTFTTLGFGEFLPGNTPARYFVSGEAMLGTLHMVTFVSVWLSKFVNR